MIEPYEDETYLIGNLKGLLSLEKTEPHQFLLSAFINEEEGNLNGAAQDYLALAEGNPKAFACVAKTYSFIENSEKRDAIRIAYEELLATIDKKSSQVKAPTCFICFNVSEKDVGKWLSKNLAPDLDLAGIKPLFWDGDSTPGANRNTFHELAIRADCAMLACTPALKEKCEERRKFHAGIALEVDMLKQRLKNPKQQGSTYPIFLKGKREEALPSPYFESIFGVSFSSENSLSSETDFTYFYNAIPLLTALRKIPEKAREMQETLLAKTREILLGDFDSSKISEWRTKKEERITSVEKASQERVSALTQVVNLPLPPKNFTGREKQIQDLHDACKAEYRIAVSGLGGVGKTALALEYANQYKSHYQFVHFTLATTVQMVRNGLIKLANDLHIPKSEKEEERLEWLKIVLRKLDQEYLLIFDGVDHPEIFDEIERCVPERGRSLLLTSRMSIRAEDMSYKLLPLGRFSPEEALEFIHKVTGLSQDVFAEKLVLELGYIPLALKHAAMFIRQRNISYKKYLEEFGKENFALFSKMRVKNLPVGECTILKTWLISLETIRTFHNCDLAVDIFDFLSILANAEISLDLVEIFCKQAFSDSKTPIIDALALLSDYSLIEKSSPGNWHIHALVQAVARTQLEEEKNERYQSIALKVLAALFSEANIKSLETCLELERYVNHAETILESNIPKGNETKKFKNFKSLSNSLYEYYDFRGIYQPALRHAERLLGLHKKLLGEKHLSVACSLNCVGTSLENLGRYEEALKCFMEGLALCRAQPGEVNILEIGILNNAGNCIGGLGRYEEALKYLKEALESCRALLGEKNAYAATSLNNLGFYLGKLCRHEEALSYHMEALEHRRDLFGNKHLDVASSFCNIGLILGKLGRHKKALNYSLKALELHRDLLGKKHSHLAVSLNNIGLDFGNLGQHQKALKYKKKALELMRDLSGEDHPLVATYLNNVGHNLEELGRYEEGLQYKKEALELWRALLREDHPNVEIGLNNVVGSLRRLGRHEEALKYLKEALELRQTLLGEKHLLVATSLSSVGQVLVDLGRHQEALGYIKQSIGLQKMIYQKNHPNIVSGLNTLTTILEMLRRYNEVLGEMKKYCEFIEHHQGMNHPDAIKWRIVLENRYHRFQKQS